METLMKYAFEPKAQAMARQIYPAIITDSAAQHYYGMFLRGVLNAKGGVLWHCSQGKDRAGWASGFLLAALGASRENFEATLDLIDQRYGSLSEYIENQLGFSKEEQQQLRTKYLVMPNT